MQERDFWDSKDYLTVGSTIKFKTLEVLESKQGTLFSRQQKCLVVKMAVSAVGMPDYARGQAW
jgi:hypothetical protein